MMTRYQKLLRFANDPSATPAEKELYRRKAEEINPAKYQMPHYKDQFREFGEKCGMSESQILEMELRHVLTYHRSERIGANGETIVTNCCCSFPGASMRECADSRAKKSPCMCWCHPRKIRVKKSNAEAK